MPGLDRPLSALAPGMALALAVLLGAFGVLAWRATILLRLGVRQIPRRRARAALIVFGLTLSTTVIAGALGTGDTMAYSVRSLVAQSLGPVDEVVTLYPPRTSSRDQARALVSGGLGGLSTAGLGLFDQAAADPALAAARDSHAVAGATPAVVDQVSVVDPASRQTESGLLLVALPAPYPSGFGALRTEAGAPVAFGDLGPGDVVLNAPAAQLLGATPGRSLEVQTRGVTWKVRVAAVAAGDALGGAQATVIAPLAGYQQAIGAAGQVNAVLVANRGGADSVLLSDEVSQALRVSLANRDAVRQVHTYLAHPEVQRALVAAESQLSAADRGRVEALRAEAARPEVTPRFVSLVTDPVVRRQLFSLAGAAPPAGGRASIYGLLRDASALSVFAVKQSTLDQTNRVGSVVTTVFLVLGIFSFAASALLVFLVFSLLAADRAADLATMRALGMTRRQIMAVFLFEGLPYDLAGAAIGAVAGIATALLTSIMIDRSLALFGLHLAWHVAPRSILVAFAAGVLLTFAAMVAAAWRVSRAGIVAATRGSLVDERRDWLAVPGGLLVLAAGFVWHRWRIPPAVYEPRNPLVLPGALSLALLGLACFAQAASGAVARRGAGSARWVRRAEAAGDGVVTLVAAAIGVVWVQALAALPTPFGDLRADAVAVAVAGVVLIVAATMAVARLLGPLLGLLDRMLSRAGRLRAVVRPAAGELARQRGRAGLAVVMFGMVIFTVVAGLTLIDALATAYGGDEPPIGGFQLRADQSGAQPIDDMAAALATARTVSPSAFSAVGGVTPLDVQIVQVGVPTGFWHGATLAAVDDGFLQGIQARIDRPAPGYDSASAWAAVRDRPGTAVVSASLLGGTVLAPGLGIRSSLDPLTVWMRPGAGGQPVKLTVIGIIDSRSSLDPAIYTSRRTAQALGVALPPPGYFLFAVQPGLKESSVAAGLRLAFGDRGLSVSSLDDRFQIVQSIRGLLTEVVQGFMSLGLVAGVASLGMLSVQSVIERRAQLGTLRALGFTRWQTRATLALESTAIAAAGIGIGIALGLALAHSLLALLAQSSPEVRFVVPWGDIWLTAGVAWAGSTLAAATGVWQAGRVSPAEALRAA